MFLYIKLMHYLSSHLATSLQLILEISATYRLAIVCYLSGWAHTMPNFQEESVKSIPCDGVFVAIYFKRMYNKTIIRFGFGDIRNNQGLG